MAVGEIKGSALDTFRALLADLFLPVLQEQSSWGKMPPQHTKDFLSGADRVGAGCVGWLRCPVCLRCTAPARPCALCSAASGVNMPLWLLEPSVQVLGTRRPCWQRRPTACRVALS